MNKPKVLAIVGPTASGKSDLAVELALRFNGEIISADSRQVYRGLDIGSGKITSIEMRGVAHHALDIANPKTDTFTAVDFVDYANQALEKILNKEKLPIIAGGTFLYLDLLRGSKASAPVPPNLTLRAELEKLTTEKLFENLQKKDLARAKNIDQNNRRRLIRSLEIIAVLGKVPKEEPKDSPYDWLIIGIDVEKDLLHERIAERLNKRLEQGMVEEVRNLLGSGVPSSKLKSFGLEYRFITEFILGEINQEQMKVEIINKSKQFAKRQHTWLKTNQEIIWQKYPIDLEEVSGVVREFLNNKQ